MDDLVEVTVESQNELELLVGELADHINHIRSSVGFTNLGEADTHSIVPALLDELVDEGVPIRSSMLDQCDSSPLLDLARRVERIRSRVPGEVVRSHSLTAVVRIEDVRRIHSPTRHHQGILRNFDLGLCQIAAPVQMNGVDGASDVIHESSRRNCTLSNCHLHHLGILLRTLHSLMRTDTKHLHGEVAMITILAGTPGHDERKLRSIESLVLRLEIFGHRDHLSIEPYSPV